MDYATATSSKKIPNNLTNTNGWKLDGLMLISTVKGKIKYIQYTQNYPKNE